MKIDKRILTSVLQGSLPGWHAQKFMAPEVGDRYQVVADNHRPAAVMALIKKDEVGKDSIIIIERAKHNPNDKHAGQLSFPGGKYEEEDGDMLTCALREVEEEIGIPSDSIEVLGPLTQLYVFASNFLVYPFVGYVNGNPSYIKQDSEVHSILEVPLDIILSQENKLKKDISIPRGKLRNVPYYKVGEHVLWGATAMIMSEFEYVLSQSHDSK